MVWVEVFMTIDINVMRRLVAGELTTTGADKEAWLELPHGFSTGELEAWPEFYSWTDAAVAYLRLLEEHERLKAELEEQRLVLRAHLYDWRGRINPEWEPDNRMWRRTFPDGRTGQVSALYRDEEYHTVTWTMGVLGSVAEGRRPAVTGGTADNLREGMRAVEAAWAATASPRPPSPADGA